VGDAAAIHAVHAAAFPSDAEARLVDALRDAGHAAVSLVALESKIVGHVLFSPTRSNQGRGVGLAPLAVLPQYQRQGIGAALASAGIGACRSAGYDYIVVLGEPAYYRRFGFRRARDFGEFAELG